MNTIKKTEMENEIIIDEALYDLGIDGMEPRKKSPVLSAGITALGIILLVLSFTAVKGHPDLASGVMLCGVLITVAGAIRLAMDISGKGKPYYKPTDEFLKRYELMFDPDQKANVLKYVEDGDFESLVDIKPGETSAIKAVIYKTGGNDLAIAQVLQYVPHTYRAAGEIKVFGKGGFIRSAKLC